MEQARNERIKAIDALRGVAILAVMLTHAYSDTGRDKIGVPFLGGLWAGVDLFFVLSGFFIGGQLFREIQRTGTLAVGRFWLRRWFRIFPAYITAYGLMTLVPIQAALRHSTWTAAADRAASAIPVNLVFLQNYLGNGWPHSWSLAVEEHFYLGLPLLLIAWRRMRKGRVGDVTTATAALCGVLLLEIAIRAAEIAHFGVGIDLYNPTHVHLDGLAVGVWLAWLFTFAPAIAIRAARISPLIVLAAVIGAWFYASSTPGVAAIGQADALRYPLLAVAFGLWTAFAAARSQSGADATRGVALLAWIGRYSYCLYLSQAVVREMPYYYVLHGWLMAHAGWPVTIVLFFSGSLVGALALSHGVERPMLRLRDRLFPSRTTADQSVAPAIATGAA